MSLTITITGYIHYSLCAGNITNGLSLVRAGVPEIVYTWETRSRNNGTPTDMVDLPVEPPLMDFLRRCETMKENFMPAAICRNVALARCDFLIPPI